MTQLVDRALCTRAAHPPWWNWNVLSFFPFSPLKFWRCKLHSHWCPIVRFLRVYSIQLWSIESALLVLQTGSMFVIPKLVYNGHCFTFLLYRFGSKIRGLKSHPSIELFYLYLSLKSSLQHALFFFTLVAFVFLPSPPLLVDVSFDPPLHASLVIPLIDLVKLFKRQWNLDQDLLHWT